VCLTVVGVLIVGVLMLDPVELGRVHVDVVWVRCKQTLVGVGVDPGGVTFYHGGEVYLHVASSFMRCRAASRSVLLLVLGQLCGYISGPSSSV
jgi:hypothetical protein